MVVAAASSAAESCTTRVAGAASPSRLISASCRALLASIAMASAPFSTSAPCPAQ